MIQKNWNKLKGFPRKVSRKAYFSWDLLVTITGKNLIKWRVRNINRMGYKVHIIKVWEKKKLLNGVKRVGWNIVIERYYKIPTNYYQLYYWILLIFSVI